MNIFGNNLMQVCIGGAPFNAEVEKFLDQIKFPYTIAYGMTECGPMICNDQCSETRYRSCGKVVDRMEVRIDSKDPHNIPGEMWVRGENVMLGYYKDKAATDKVMDGEWLCTGDMATIDNDGYVYIKGRSKNMLLSASGQNIYPEEIEAVVNNQPYVAESVVVYRGGKIVDLVYLDDNQIKDSKLDSEAVADIPENIKLASNKHLPNYSKISMVEIRTEPFEKTPKMSVKRFMYK
jgi:long-chain acyl-CoA synthetase